MINKYPYTNFHELNLDWVISIVKDYVAKTDALTIDVEQLKAYIDNYFESADFAQIVNNKIDELVADGTFTALFAEYTTRIYNTVADMKADNLLTVGARAHTLGYYNIGDGGDAYYNITDVTPLTWYEVITNGLNAQLINNGIANIVQYGAKEGGDTDSTNALQNALNSNYKVIIPKGDYLISSVTVPADVELINNGHIIASATPLITLSDNSIINGGEFSSNITNASCLQATDVENIHISNVNISGFANKGIAFTNVANSVIENVIISGANGTTGGGISIAGASHDNNINNININDSRIGLIFQSSYMNNANNINISNCPTMGVCFDGTVTGSGDGAYKINISNVTVTGQTNTSYGAIYAGNGSHDLVVNNFNIDACALGFKATGNANNLINNWRISNGIITNSSTFGIQLSYAQNTHINNVIVDTAPTGVTFYGADYGLLANSTVKNCTTRGVMVQAGNCMVIANKILNNGTGIQYAYGATSPVHNSMFNNLFEGNTTDATLAGSPVVANNVNYTA